ncbi:MAG TPA: AAA domain-containing protein [Microbacteriaceae bacterium]|nr:AAA domain-containing protein [Microbacteriaceae bacterium]
MRRASEEWRKSLIDVGGGNRLLFFRQTATTIPLAQADPRAVQNLVEGDRVSLRNLFPKQEDFAKAQKACAGLDRRQRQAQEEYGLSVLYLAVGFATWQAESTTTVTPNAPVLLRSLQLEKKRGAQENWFLQVDEEIQLNSVLEHLLNADKKRINEEFILDAEGDDDLSLDRFEAACADVPGFLLSRSLTIGAFSYQNEAMVEDITNIDALLESDMARALSGEASAVEAVRAQPGQVDPDASDYAPVDSEFLVLDADASQSYAVNAVCAGRNLVIEGPPGTGKSQTIANLIASLVAHKKRVLFVAQKKAAIDAVLARLKNVELDHLVMDAFSSANSRKYASAELRDAVERRQATGVPRVDSLHRSLRKQRDLLVGRKDAMRSAEFGWGISAEQILTGLASVPEECRMDFSISTKAFASWGADTLEELEDAVRELHSLGALAPSWSEQNGWNPKALKSTKAVEESSELIRVVQGELLPDGLDALNALVDKASLDAPVRLDELPALLERMDTAADVYAVAPKLLGKSESAESVRNYLASWDKAFRRDSGLKLGMLLRRRYRKASLLLLGSVSPQQRPATLRSALMLWETTTLGATPAPPKKYAQYRDQISQMRSALQSLDSYLIGLKTSEQELERIHETLRRLDQDSRRFDMPTVHKLGKQLRDAGLTRLIDVLATSPQTEWGDQDFGLILRWVVLKALLSDAYSKYPSALGAPGERFDEAALGFREADVEHLKANAARVQRLAAEHLKAVLDDNPDEYAVLKKELTRSRNFKSVRTLFEEAPNVILAAKPVWAMSPLAVSRLVPAEQLFDVVIFDEASQVKPADGIPAIMRAAQVVVAGDSKQLPPTSFFAKVLDDSMDNDEQEDLALEAVESDGDPSAQVEAISGGETLTADAESILFAIDRVLAGQSRRLLWHYRSRDERLIAVSNAHVYQNTLTTFPASDTPDALRHEVVPFSKGIGGTTNSPELEVQRVVELVKEHFESRPDESLGVITFGVKHQRRVEAAISLLAASDEAFAEAISDGPDPFFIKNIESVQGDERDAIILSLGYGKDAAGKLKMFWGPLLKEGGQRRLNVAISRARRRMTLVTSFSADDVADDMHSSEGFKLFYRFLRFMASNGEEISGGPDERHPMNPFELDIFNRLTEAGLQLRPQFGVGSYRLDFAVRHPDFPGRYVMAIEADGASYHSGVTARERDRLRQELLEQRGWNFHRIWSTDWFGDPSAEIQKVRAAYEQALRGIAPAVADHDAGAARPKWSVSSLERDVPLPPFIRGLPIDEYPPHLLDRILSHVRSDKVMRTKSDEVEEIFQLLGYRRRGTKIMARLERLVR